MPEAGRSDAFAAALAAEGFAPGDRAALCLQNVPEFVIALLGVWKAGGIAVPVNPMNKARENTHRNLAFNAQTYRDLIGIGSDDVILGGAPMFHITGMVGHVALSLLTGARLILMDRFDPARAIDMIRAERATFTVGSITVFIALLNAPRAVEILEEIPKTATGKLLRRALRDRPAAEGG